MSETTRILFVCLGNIIRSPLAETLLRHQAEAAGLGDKYEIDSAGTASYHVGERPDARMRQVAAKNGVEHDGRARQVRASDFEDFDLILPMDASNLANLKRVAANEEQAAKLRLMREFDPQAAGETEVPDPYYGGIDGFDEVFAIVERSTAELLRRLEAGEV